MVENRSLETEGVRRNSEQRICPTCSKEEHWRHTLKYEGRKIWRVQNLGKRFSNIGAEIDIVTYGPFLRV
jgi:ribosomal protein L37AE/L43A